MEEIAEGAPVGGFPSPECEPGVTGEDTTVKKGRPTGGDQVQRKGKGREAERERVGGEGGG